VVYEPLRSVDAIERLKCYTVLIFIPLCFHGGLSVSREIGSQTGTVLGAMDDGLESDSNSEQTSNMSNSGATRDECYLQTTCMYVSVNQSSIP